MWRKENEGGKAGGSGTKPQRTFVLRSLAGSDSKRNFEFLWQRQRKGGTWNISRNPLESQLKEGGKKQSKKVEELPKFLLSVTRRTNYPFKKVKDFRKQDVDAIGPIFFGGCRQFHPKPHRRDIFSFSSGCLPSDSQEDIWRNLFKEEEPVVKKKCSKKLFRLVKTQLPIPDLRPHRARGKLVRFQTEPLCSKPNLGKTKSKIIGETIREILNDKPMDQTFRSDMREFLQEKKRNLLEENRRVLPPELRAAHLHFPKEFIKVQVFGPTIPASLTICQLQVREANEKEEKFPKVEIIESCERQEKSTTSKNLIQMEITQNEIDYELISDEKMLDEILSPFQNH